MINKYIKLILIFVFLFLIFPLNTHAYDSGYEIEKYDIDIKVNENHTLDVVEKINVNFKKKRHGIKRMIPKRNIYVRKINNKKEEIKEEALATNFYVNEQFNTEEPDYFNYVLKIGDPNKKITGNKEYIIKYNYNMGDDYISEFDDLYYNIIGTKWDCYIKNVNFKITMPKEFDKNKVDFTMGDYGSINNARITYKVENNVISGSINKNEKYALNPEEGLTIRIELPEGYYQNESIMNLWGKSNIGDEYFDNYNVVATLKENNTMHVEEEFDTKMSSFSKNIDIKGYHNPTYKDLYYDYKITNIWSNEEFSKKIYGYKDEKSLYLNFNNYTNEFKHYHLSYDIDFKEDLQTDVDYFIFNLIDSDKAIKNFNYKIVFPKPIDENNIYLNEPYDEDKIKYTYNDNVLDINIDKNYFGYSVIPDSNYKIEVTLPEGYFKNTTKMLNPFEEKIKLFVEISFVLLFISILIYIICKRKKDENIIISYTPPYDLSPSEIGYVYNGKVKNKHIVSLIIYFANKKYLRIKTKDNSFTLEKLCDIPESEPEYAVITFKGLFKNRNSVSEEKLKNTFYKTLKKSKLKLKHTHKMYFEINLFFKIMLALIIYISLVIFGKGNMIISEYYISYNENIIKIILNILTILTIIFNLISFKKFKIINKTEQALYNKILGFREFIKTVEKDKLEEIGAENPNYFYDVLPYAYVLDVTDVWCKKFESITIAPPTWYDGFMYSTTTGEFDINRFNNSLTSTLSSVSTTMSSSPYESSGSSSGGNFSDGGGFSGGGGGGGGGSSW